MNLVQQEASEPPRDEQTVQKRHKQYSRKPPPAPDPFARRSRKEAIAVVGPDTHVRQVRAASLR